MSIHPSQINISFQPAQHQFVTIPVELPDGRRFGITILQGNVSENFVEDCKRFLEQIDKKDANMLSRPCIAKMDPQNHTLVVEPQQDPMRSAASTPQVSFTQSDCPEFYAYCEGGRSFTIEDYTHYYKKEIYPHTEQGTREQPLPLPPEIIKKITPETPNTRVNVRVDQSEKSPEKLSPLIAKVSVKKQEN